MSLRKLHDIVARLRDPDTGCPWDQRQDFDSIAAYTLEETYELIDAIIRRDYDELRNELGDLLLQVVFHAQIAAENNLFSLEDVQSSICEKMIRRHPHVFGDTDQRTQDEARIKQTWEAEKVRERVQKNHHGTLGGVPLALPALKRAQKLQKRTASVGFDWQNKYQVIEKIREEIDELEQAIKDDIGTEILNEAGDLLFSCVNLTRHLKIDAEMALIKANRKFETRFNKLEASVEEEGRKPQDCSPEELDAIWSKVKQTEVN